MLRLFVVIAIINCIKYNTQILNSSSVEYQMNFFHQVGLNGGQLQNVYELWMIALTAFKMNSLSVIECVFAKIMTIWFQYAIPLYLISILHRQCQNSIKIHGPIFDDNTQTDRMVYIF